MDSPLRIEEATDNGKVVGWRLNVAPSGMGSSYDTMLVFADQTLPGFRMGQGFVANYNGTIEYREVFAASTPSGGADNG